MCFLFSFIDLFTLRERTHTTNELNGLPPPLFFLYFQ